MSPSDRTPRLMLAGPPKCPTCGNETHEPGQSKFSNCGEDEIVHPGYAYFDGIGGADSQIGSRSYIPSRFYTRKGEPRLEFRR